MCPMEAVSAQGWGQEHGMAAFPRLAAGMLLPGIPCPPEIGEIGETGNKCDLFFSNCSKQLCCANLCDSPS